MNILIKYSNILRNRKRRYGKYFEDKIYSGYNLALLTIIVIYEIKLKFISEWPKNTKITKLLILKIEICLKVIEYSNRNIRDNDLLHEVWYELVDCWYRMGDYSKSKKCFEKYFKLTRKKRILADEYELDNNYLHSFGEFALQIDCFLKTIKLGYWQNEIKKIKKDYKFICKLDRPPPNQYLRKILEKYINFIDSNNENPQKEIICKIKQRWLPLENENFDDHAVNFPAICKIWEKENRHPLFVIDEETITACYKILKKYGLEPHEKFVTLHLAENEGYHSARRVNNPETYISSINYLNISGYRVIRIGRKVFPALNCTDLIDVSQGEHPDFLDVFLLAKCQFALCSASGPNSVPAIFGTPSMWTNNYPWIPAPLKSDLALYKRLYNGKRFLSASEIFKKYAFVHSSHALEADSISLVDNSSDEILEGVKEMLQRVNTNNFTKTKKQLLFDNLRKDSGLVEAGSSIAESFINKYYEEIIGLKDL